MPVRLACPRLAAWIVILIVGLLAAPTAFAERSPLVGKPAPLLSGRAAFGHGLMNLTRLQNQIVYERDAAGNLVKQGKRLKFRVVKNAAVLNFFATYCVPCVREIPSFNKIAKSYEGQPVVFVYVNVDTEKSARQVRDFAKSKGIAVEMILPSVRYALQAYKIDSLPRIVVVDSDGKVAHVIFGFQPDLAAQLAEVITPLLPKPGTASTR